MYYTVAEIIKKQQFNASTTIAFIGYVSTNYEARALTTFNPEADGDVVTHRLVSDKNVNELLFGFFLPHDITNTKEYFERQQKAAVEAMAKSFYDMVRVTCIEMHIDDPESCPPDNARQMVDPGWFNDMWSDHLLEQVTERVKEMFEK